MAMAGSAIGLGNIWRFPYMVGEHGGAAYILIYLLATIFLSLPIFLSESIIGRRTQLGTFGAFEKLAPGTPWKYMGFVTICSALIILSFYSVVGGWSIDYLFKSLSLRFSGVEPSSVPALFGALISEPWVPVLCHTVFLGLTAIIVGFGVKNGIERFSSITLPLLFLLIVVIMVYSLSLPGAYSGVTYLVKPDFSKIDAAAVASAMGQSFFSLSLGVGTILTYSSHIRKEENLLTSGFSTAMSDVMFALLAGFAVMPAVFAAGIEPGAGPGLIFETLPYIFAQMGTTWPVVSAVVAILFFLTILVAALTSSISMLETGVTYLEEQKGMGRWKAVAILFAMTWTLGMLCSLSFGPLSDVKLLGNSIFEFCDKLTANFLMTAGGFMFTIFAGWKMSRSDIRDELTSGAADGASAGTSSDASVSASRRLTARLFPLLYFLIRYIAPLVIITIFITNLVL